MEAWMAQQGPVAYVGLSFGLGACLMVGEWLALRRRQRRAKDHVAKLALETTRESAR